MTSIHKVTCPLCSKDIASDKCNSFVIFRPVTRGGARGAFAPPHILILNMQVKECSRLN